MFLIASLALVWLAIPVLAGRLIYLYREVDDIDSALDLRMGRLWDELSDANRTRSALVARVYDLEFKYEALSMWAKDELPSRYAFSPEADQETEVN